MKTNQKKPFPKRKIKVPISEDNKTILYHVEFNAEKISDNLYIHKKIDLETKKPSLKRNNVLWIVTAIPSGIAIFEHYNREIIIEVALKLSESGLDFSKKTMKDFRDDTIFMEEYGKLVKQLWK